MKKISILLPVYNEEESIYNLLSEYAQFFELNKNIDFSIIVVNDNSCDSTETFILKAIKDFSKLNIQYKKNEFNKGLHGILKDELFELAMNAADDEVIITMDGDNTHNPSSIKYMLDEIDNGAEIVIASRYCAESKIYGLSLFRILLSFFARLSYAFAWRINGVKDYTINYRAYRASILKKLVNEYGRDFISEEGFTAVAELLKLMKKYNPVIAEVPVVLTYSNKLNSSNMHILSTIVKSIKLLFKK